MSTEDRVITASLSHFEKSGNQQVVKLCHMFALFPEDVPVPLSFFDLFAESVFGFTGKRAQLQVRNSINALLRRSMLLGSLKEGVYQHDIIRHYCIAHVTDLPRKQRLLVEAMLATRPANGKWVRSHTTSKGSVEYYVATYGFWHVRAAMDGGVDSQLLDKLVSNDPGLAEACGVALGLEVMRSQADARELSANAKERKHDSMMAAQILYAASMAVTSGRISLLDEFNCLSRSQKLLQHSKDAKAIELELVLLPRLLYHSHTFDQPQVPALPSFALLRLVGFARSHR